jgi:hypothetical protein
MRRFVGAALASGFAISALVPLTILAEHRPPRGLDTALIHHLASVVPRFRKAMEQAQA